MAAHKYPRVEIPLEAEEQRYLEERIYPPLTDYAKSLEFFLSAWCYFVGSQATDFADFRSELMGRDLLQTIILEGPPTLGAKVAAAIAEADAFYLRQTYLLPFQIMSSPHGEAAWWMYRLAYPWPSGYQDEVNTWLAGHALVLPGITPWWPHAKLEDYRTYEPNGRTPVQLLPLTDEDRSFIKDVLRSKFNFGGGWHPERLVHRWWEYVFGAARDPELIWGDLAEHLCFRARLDRYIEAVPPALAAKLREALREPDEVYFQETVPIPLRLLRDLPDSTDADWNRRLPKLQPWARQLAVKLGGTDLGTSA